MDRLSFMRSLLPQVTPRYFGSEWSYAQIRGLEARTIVAFGAREHTAICALRFVLRASVASWGKVASACTFVDGP